MFGGSPRVGQLPGASEITFRSFQIISPLQENDTEGIPIEANAVFNASSMRVG